MVAAKTKLVRSAEIARSVSVSEGIAAILVDRVFCLCWSRCPLAVAMVVSKNLVMFAVVKPGHDCRKLLLAA